jgi:hypothetical protein
MNTALNRRTLTTPDPATSNRLSVPSKTVQRLSRDGWLALGVVAAGWLVLLVSVGLHPLYVSHDSISNNAHVWYVGQRLWDGHGLPLHMPMLAQGQALAFPYAFIPWTSAAVLRPLLGDRVVTFCLVGGFLALVALVFWALPELRRGWPAAAVLVNPALVMALLVGQIPFIWATALLFAAIGAWRRDRRWAATGLAGLAMATHPAVVAPIILLVVVGYLPFARYRWTLLGHAMLATLIALPAGWMLVRSPAVEETSLWFRVEQLVRTAGARGLVVALPIGLCLLATGPRRKIAPVAFALCCAVNLISLGPMNRYAWASPWRTPDEGVSAVIDSPSFVPSATYRVLGYSDGRVSMYRLIQHGARLDSEFFPESQARHSWASAADYERFLAGRHVDFVMVWGSYDRRWGTNEHDLLRAIAIDPTCTNGPLSAQLIMTEQAFELFGLHPCQPT